MARTLRLGLFIVVTLTILAVGVFLIGNNTFRFRSTYRLQASFPTVAGLDNGAEVRVGGIHKGTVSYIELPNRPDGKVTVVMSLERRTRSVIKKDSVASIQTEGLLGSKFVQISFGSPNAAKVENGDTIPSEPPLDMSDLMKKTDQILDSTKDTMANAAVTADNLKSMTSKINEGKGTAGALINDKTMYDQLNGAVTQAKSGATAFQEDMEALKHNFFLRGFFHKRGYEDSDQLAKNQLTRLPDTPSLKTFSYDTKKLFNKPDAAKLKDQKVLNDAGRFLQENKFGLAVVVASSGDKGDTEKDKVISQGQALAVRDYLVKNFKMDDTHLKTMARGKDPAGPAEGGVEVMVYPPGTQVPTETNLAKSGH